MDRQVQNMPQLIELTADNVCRICKNHYGKYTCPRCNIKYCSIECYKSQSHIDCSESFYQECILEEMAASTSNNHKNGNDSRQKMEEILSKVKQYDDQNLDEFNTVEENESNDSDDEFSRNLADRLRNLDLNNADLVWENLTQDEQQEFEALIASGEASNLVPEWKAWWQYSKPKLLVEELNGGGQHMMYDYKKDCPSIKQPINDFNMISSSSPADCVKYNIVNVLAAYVFTVRYFNGDHWDYYSEAISIIVLLSLNLKSNANFPDVQTAIDSVKIEAFNHPFLMIDEENIKWMYDDIKSLINGPEQDFSSYYSLAALSDFYAILVKLKSKNKQQKQNGEPMTINNKKIKGSFTSRFMDQFNIPKIESSKLNQIKKKIDYYLSYIQKFGLI